MLIDVEGWHGLWNRLTEAVDASLEAESALDSARLRDIREEVSFEHDLSASLVWSTRWGQPSEFWLRIIAKSEACVHKIHAVERNLHWERGCNEVIRRRATDNTNSGDEFCAHSLISNFAVWDHSVVKSEIKPGPRDFNWSASRGQTLFRPHFLDDWLMVIVVLDWRLSEKVSVTLGAQFRSLRLFTGRGSVTMISSRSKLCGLRWS